MRTKYFPFKVLLVEDDPIIAKIHKEMLKESTQEIDHAENGEQAIIMAGINNYDLILLDLGLPDINGVDVALQIHQTKQNETTPIVALTACHIDAIEQKCLAAGIEKIIIKPTTPEILRQLIHTYAERCTERSGDDTCPN